MLAAQALFAAVSYYGDLAEHHYLELKSTLDPSANKDKEKIANFILGAASRTADLRVTAFQGYGVVIVGAAPGSSLASLRLT